MDWQLQSAKNRLSALIDKVVAGEEQVITRHGKPVAVVVPYGLWQQRGAKEQPSLFEAVRELAAVGGLPDMPRPLEDDSHRIPRFDEG